MPVIHSSKPILRKESYEVRQEHYSEAHCWQYDLRVRNLKEDLQQVGLSAVEAGALRVKDFTFHQVNSATTRQEMVQFIKRHEWLGTITQYTTHWFACYYKEHLAGVVLMGVPNAFSKIIGEETPQLERLISRGACISWSPKNLASAFVMWSIKWMVKHTPYRLFTAYSDPIAKELGTIYQACNFYYMGKDSGSSVRYISPWTGNIISDRAFRHKTAYQRYAKELNIPWQCTWKHNTGMNWDKIPPAIATALRAHSKVVQNSSQRVEVLPKHKYAYLLGKTPYETKRLQRQYLTRHSPKAYPKLR